MRSMDTTSKKIIYELLKVCLSVSVDAELKGPKADGLACP